MSKTFCKKKGGEKTLYKKPMSAFSLIFLVVFYRDFFLGPKHRDFSKPQKGAPASKQCTYLDAAPLPLLSATHHPHLSYRHPCVPCAVHLRYRGITASGERQGSAPSLHPHHRCRGGNLVFSLYIWYIPSAPAALAPHDCC